MNPYRERENLHNAETYSVDGDSAMCSLSEDALTLLERADEVLTLLDNTNGGSIADALASPLLRSPGEGRSKGFRLPEPLIDEVEGFAGRTRLTQRQIIEAALVEFLRRHGGDVE